MPGQTFLLSLRGMPEIPYRKSYVEQENEHGRFPFSA